MSPSNKDRPATPDRLQDPRRLPFAEPRKSGDLPHLEKEGCTFFVTFCLQDAVPNKLRKRASLRSDSMPEDVGRRSEPPDAGTCLLRQPAIASLVEKALLHFQGQRYALHAWCVMPNHVHVVVTPHPGSRLADILHSWKSFAAHRVNRELGTKSRVWESESFDHMVRSHDSVERFVAYTELNPVHAGLCKTPGDWPFSSAARRSAAE